MAAPNLVLAEEGIARWAASRSRRAASSGTRLHSVSHLAVFSVAVPSSAASTSAAAAVGARPEHRTGAVLGLPYRPQAGHGGRLARPGRAHQDVERSAGGGHLLHRQGLVEAQPVWPSGQQALAGAGHRGGAHGRGLPAPARVEQPGLGVEERLGGVQRPALRAQTGRAVGATVSGWGMAHLGGRDRQRSAQG